MIIDIGRKSIMDAARQIAAWMPAEGDPPQIAVNVSGKRFAAVGLVDEIERALKITEAFRPMQRSWKSPRA